MIRYDNLLQNATDLITKCDRSLLQNPSGFLLKSATVLLQNTTVVTKCDVCYKLRQYNSQKYANIKYITVLKKSTEKSKVKDSIQK